MIHRVSGTFFGKPFTGTICTVYKAVTFNRTHHLPIVLSAAGSQKIANGIVFHKRHKVFLGEIMIGWVVDRGDDWVAEPINHAFLNPDGTHEPGRMSAPYQDWDGALGFFRSALPAPCRSHLRVVEQIIEHTILAVCKGAPSASKS